MTQFPAFAIARAARAGAWPSRLGALAMAGAIAALTGCAAPNGSGTATTPVDDRATGSTPPAPPPAGLPYPEVLTAAQGPLAQARQALVGQKVAIELQALGRRGAPSSTYQVQAGDDVLFRCLSSARGFSGGQVVTEVRAVRGSANGRTRTVDLARCDSGATATPPPASTPPPAADRPGPASGGAGAVGAGKPGMDARGNVVDSSKVESGSGRTVKGINDYEGEITGNPARGSRFTRLQIGMPVKQVTDLIGQPTDQGAYMTGKAWIPFYFGGDRHRFELVYKGQGRLIFAGGGVGNFTSGNLIWIIHNANEGGYR